MKFKRCWLEEKSLLPACLENACIDYKRWKKAKNIGKDVIVLRLFRDMQCVDDLLRKKPSLCMFQCKNSMSYLDDVTKLDKYKFAALNKLCVYKICKRLDKRYNIGMTKWLNDIRCRFAFMGGFYMKRMECELFGCNEECPICMDSEKVMVISECGHNICFECLEYMYKIKGKRGIMRNIIAAYDCEYKIHCPICRSYAPYSKIDDDHVWPSTKENVKMLTKVVH